MTYWRGSWNLEVHDKQEGWISQREHGIDPTPDRRAAGHMVMAIPVFAHIDSEGLEAKQPTECGARMHFALIIQICSTTYSKTAIWTCNAH
jgi:hypothetical protein